MLHEYFILHPACYKKYPVQQTYSIPSTRNILQSEMTARFVILWVHLPCLSGIPLRTVPRIPQSTSFLKTIHHTSHPYATDRPAHIISLGLRKLNLVCQCFAVRTLPASTLITVPEALVLICRTKVQYKYRSGCQSTAGSWQACLSVCLSVYISAALDDWQIDFRVKASQF
jgi:hypothetical protein